MRTAPGFILNEALSGLEAVQQDEELDDHEVPKRHDTVHGYALERTLNGNRRIEVTTLKTSSIVNPKILKGNRISQRSGKTKSAIMAIGQQMMSSIHQSTREIKSFI